MIDWKRPIRTKKGELAELIHVLEGEEYPRVVVIQGEYRREVVRYNESGRYFDDQTTMSDLENVPEQTSYYLNVFKGGSSAAYHSMEDAERDRTSRHTGTKFGGTLHLTFEGRHLVGVEKIDD